MTAEAGRGNLSPLRALGLAVLPAPRKFELKEGAARVGLQGRGLALAGVHGEDLSVRTLRRTLDTELGIALSTQGDASRQLSLAIVSGAIKTGTNDGRDEQAYRIEISPDRIALTGNGRPGLFYAVQTLLQLAESGGGSLPQCRIEDWPEYELRCIHWDTKHHQDRPETLRRYIDEAARFKVNAIIFELEDKFEYPSHPIIGAPGAFTTAELQALVDYALERHIQIIPCVQSPAHMAYVLKHEEFAHLRCDGSNYQICMDDPEARKLLFDMYDDVCEATRGVRYFLVSTDEVYYAGICEKYRKPYNPENRSLTWVDYVNAAHKHLAARGRRVIVWAEYPLLPEHVKLLPRDILNGVCSNNETQTRLENEHGIRQFAYCAMQGSDLLFPNYFGFIDRDGGWNPGRLAGARSATLTGPATRGNPIGTIAAFWDDSGLHGETAWLGWAMMAQASWTPGLAVEQAVADFVDVFYGGDAAAMVELYPALQAAARFYEFSHERLPSKVRGPAYGEWWGKEPLPRTDRALVPPALPAPADLALEPAFRPRYAKTIAEAPARLADVERLLLRLSSHLTRVRRNHYNIEVFISIAHLVRHFLRTLLGVAAAEDQLAEAAKAAKDNDHRRALDHVVAAHNRVRSLDDGLYEMFDRLRTTWEKSRFPKGRAVGSRKFVHIMDDVKDHLGDRRPDLTYIISPEENIGLRGWMRDLRNVARRYAAAKGLPPPFPEEPTARSIAEPDPKERAQWM